MEINGCDDAVESALESLNNLVKSAYKDTMASILVASNGSEFLSIWKKETKATEATDYNMKYLPLFYVIASQNTETKISLKLITFHGKILEELNGFNNLLSDEDKIHFVGKLQKMKICQGVKMPDNDLKLDASTFSAMYLVERLEQNIIVRSHQCQYGLYGDSVCCKMCNSLNTAYSSNKTKYEPGDEDILYFDTGLDDSLQSGYEDDNVQPFSNLPLQLEGNGMICDNEVDVEGNQDLPLVKITCKKNKKKIKKKKSISCQKIKLELNSIKPENKTVVKCKHCPHETNDIKLLMLHNIEVHTPGFNGAFCDQASMYQCEECSYSTTIKKEYTEHMHTYHDTTELYECKICGKLLGRKDSLKSHMNTVHKRPFKCPSCPYETAQESRLTR